MVEWHLPLAISGQHADLPAGSLRFDPKVPAPFTLPVYLPGVLGTLEAAPAGAADDAVTSASAVTYTLRLSIGSLSLKHLAVGASVCDKPVDLHAGQPGVSWGGLAPGRPVGEAGAAMTFY